MEACDTVLQISSSAGVDGVASPVTGSCHVGGLSSITQGESSVTHTVTYSTERDSAGGTVQKKPSSLDFAEQIRRLEIEGNKLRAATVSSLGSLNGYSFDTSDSYEVPKIHTSSLGNLSSLVDISSDQKCISDLRVQLENQRKETERLQKQLLGDMSTLRNISSTSLLTSGITNNNNNSFGHNISNGTMTNLSGGGGLFMHQSHSPGKSAFSTIPSGELNQTFSKQQFDYQPPSHLERSLKESQEQVMELRKKLQELTESSEQQKRQFRTTIEELKAKLHNTILNRDTVLDLRQKEANSQEHLINKLQSSLTQLQEQYKAQEEAFLSASKNLDTYSQNQYMKETALAQVRSVLVEREKRRGRPYFESDPTNEQSAAMLGHTLERCLQELDHDISMKSYKVSEIESSIENIKKSASEKEMNLMKEYQGMLKKEADDSVRKVTMLQAEHEKNLAEATENAMVASQRVTALQNELKENEMSYQRELRTKEAEIKQLEEKTDELKTDNMKTRAAFQEKRQALETSLDEVQRELIATKTEKNELIRSQAALESRLEDLQSLVTRHESDLETERDRVQQQRQREEELRSQVMNLEIHVTNKQGDIERLERMLEVVKQECSVQVLDKVASAEKLERERYLDQIKSLSAQLATMTEKCNKVSVDQQMSRSEMENLRSQVHDLTGKLEKARSQMESALAEKNELTAMLGDKRGDLDRIHRDKDHYMQLAEQKSDELTDLKITVDRLKVQLDEKEKILSTFRQQSSSINQLMEVNTKASDNIREEREKLASALADKTTMIEEMKASQDSLNRKLKTKDKRVRDLEDERLRVTEELAVKSQELDLLQQERDNILRELKQSRTEVANLTSSKDALKKELARIRALRNKEVNKLQTKLKESEQEYRLSEKALRTRDMVDHKAVKFADKIQKEMTVKRSEMDQLLSKLHKLEEKLETMKREKTSVEKDKDSLKKSLAKSLLHTQELTDELNTTQAQNQQLVARVAQLEEELEQAALKSSATSAKVEKCEQEMATLKLKHQLDLKEAERGARNKNGNIGSYFVGSTVPSSSRSTLQDRDSNSADRKPDSAGESSALTTDSCDSDVAVTRNSLEIRDRKHRDYSEVGKELKSLLGEMRNLISGHKEGQENVVNLTPLDRYQACWKTDKETNLRASPLRVQDLRVSGKVSDKEFQVETEADKSWASKSLTGLGDLSDFSSYKEWRPRSHSLTRHHRTLSSDIDTTQNSSFLSKGGYSEISRLSQSVGNTPRKPSSRSNQAVSLVPDTHELCRRLEEKINSLTRMGGNLVRENREMADLISLQGEKLDTVKQTERKARETR